MNDGSSVKFHPNDAAARVFPQNITVIHNGILTPIQQPICRGDLTYRIINEYIPVYRISVPVLGNPGTVQVRYLYIVTLLYKSDGMYLVRTYVRTYC